MNTYALTLGSHHELDVLMAGLQLLEVQTENEIERDRERGFQDEDDVAALREIRLARIKAARGSLLGATAAVR